MQTDEVFHLPRTTVFVFPFNFFSDDPLGPLTPSPWALWQLKEPQLHMVPHYYMRWLSVNPKNRLEPGGRKLKRSKSFWFHECAGWPSAHTHTHTLRAAWQDGTNVAAEDAILLGKATACGAGRDAAAATDVAKANAKWLSAAAAVCCPQSEKGERFTNQTVDIIANHLTVPYSLLLSLSIRLFCCPSLVWYLILSDNAYNCFAAFWKETNNLHFCAFVSKLICIIAASIATTHNTRTRTRTQDNKNNRHQPSVQASISLLCPDQAPCHWRSVRRNFTRLCGSNTAQASTFR